MAEYKNLRDLVSQMSTPKGVVQLTVMGDGSRTVAQAVLHTYRHPSIVARGSSGREPGDRADSAVGEDLALARALRSLAAKLERQANGRLKHAADMRAYRKVQAQRKRARGEKK